MQEVVLLPVPWLPVASNIIAFSLLASNLLANLSPCIRSLCIESSCIQCRGFALHPVLSHARPPVVLAWMAAELVKARRRVNGGLTAWAHAHVWSACAVSLHACCSHSVCSSQAPLPAVCADPVFSRAVPGCTVSWHLVASNIIAPQSLCIQSLAQYLHAVTRSSRGVQSRGMYLHQDSWHVPASSLVACTCIQSRDRRSSSSGRDRNSSGCIRFAAFRFLASRLLASSLFAFSLPPSCPLASTLLAFSLVASTRSHPVRSKPESLHPVLPLPICPHPVSSLPVWKHLFASSLKAISHLASSLSAFSLLAMDMLEFSLLASSLVVSTCIQSRGIQ